MYTSSCNHLTSHQTAHLKSGHLIEHKLKLNKVHEINDILLMLKDLSQNTKQQTQAWNPDLIQMFQAT